MKSHHKATGPTRFFLGLGALMGGLVSHAQVPPNTGDLIRQIPSESPVSRPEASLPAIGGVSLEPPLQQLPQGGTTAEIKRITLVGNRKIPSEELLSRIADALEKHHSLAELEALANRLTRYYRSRGYMVARVYIPAQEIRQGELTLRVVEGNYGKFTLQNESMVDDQVLQDVLDHAKTDEVISLDSLERAMLIINDTPGVRVVRADIMPGAVDGTADLAVETGPTSKLQGYVLLDNHGSPYTGKERVSFNLDVNSPTRQGDRLSFSGLGAINGHLLYGQAAYSTLLSPSGWRGELSAGQTTYALGDTYQALDALGVAHSYGLNLTYPLRRTRAQTIEFGLNYTQRDLKDQVRSTGSETRKSSQSFSAQLSIRDEHAWLNMDGVTQGSLRVTHGSLHIRDAQSLYLDQAAGGADTEGSFTKLNAQLSRTVLLPKDFVLQASIRHQFSRYGKNLDGSERMGISGISGVMGYPTGEASGTDAALAGLELTHPLPAIDGLQHQWHAFTNWGQARTLKQSALREISDVGLGWSARTADGLLIKAHLAHRTSDKTISEPDKSTRFLIQAGWVF